MKISKYLFLVCTVLATMSLASVKTEARIVPVPLIHDGGGTGGGSGTTYANDLIEGYTYSTYKYTPYLSGSTVPGGTKYGTLVQSNNDSSPIYEKKQTYYAGTWLAGQDAYEDFDTYRYVIYKMPIICNLPYESMNEGYYAVGDYKDVEWEKSQTQTYEKGVETTLTTSRSLEAGVKASIKMFEIGISKTTAIEASVSSSWKETTSVTETQKISRHYGISESGYYFKQRRAYYEMYVILSFEIPYTKTMTHAYEGWWYREWYNYEKKSGYIFRGYQVYYKFKTDCNNCFVRYEGTNDGVLVFADSEFKRVTGQEVLYI